MTDKQEKLLQTTSKKGLINLCKSQRNQLNQTLARANALEEWLTEYRDQLKNENVYHKNQGVINAINELLSGDESLKL